MVRSPTERIAKYQAKVTGDIYRSRYSSLKEIMVEDATAKQSLVSDFQASLKQLLVEKGVIPELTVVFMKVGMKLFGLTQKFTGATLATEATLYLNMTYCKYKEILSTTVDVGDILESIASLAGIDWSTPTKCYAST